MHKVRITDFRAPELDVYARLREIQLLNRHEPEKGIFIAESPRVIERALDAGYIPLSFLMEESQIEREAKEILARCGEIPVYTAEMEVLMQITGYRLTRGMLCAMQRKPLRTVGEVCAGAGRIAVLERVVNPTIVGAIFRSAAGSPSGRLSVRWAYRPPIQARTAICCRSPSSRRPV